MHVLQLATCRTLQKTLMESQQNQSDCGVGGCRPLDVLIPTLCSHLMQGLQAVVWDASLGEVALSPGRQFPERKYTRAVTFRPSQLPAQPSLKLRGDLGETPALTSEITMIATED